MSSKSSPNPALQALPSIGTAVGGPVGGAIGTIISTIGDLFGAKVHTTAGGETFKQASAAFQSNQATIQALQSQYNARMGLPAPNFPPQPTNGDSSQSRLWITTWIAYYLNQPALASGGSDAVVKLKNNGDFDAALKVQQTVIQDLQNGLSGLSSTSTGSTATNATTAADTPVAAIDWQTLLVYGFGAIVVFKLLGE